MTYTHYLNLKTNKMAKKLLQQMTYMECYPKNF